jgi:thiamine kinase-like enzyme
MKSEVVSIIKEIKKSGIINGIKEVSFLGKGGFSYCILIKTNDKSYVMKVRMDDQIQRLKREYKLLSQKVLVRNKLAPKVFRFDNSKKQLKFPYLLEEHIEGRNPKNKIDFYFIDSMAKWYKKLHLITTKKLESVEVKRINSISFWIENMKKKAKDIKFPSKEIESEHKRFFEKMTLIAKENDSILGRTTYNFVQCDPSKENVFIQKDKSLRLIDWDFAGYHIFERDLALFVDCYNLNSIQEKRFLQCYGINANKDFMKKFNILKLILLFSDINWLLKERSNEIAKINSKLQKGFKLMN